MMMSKKKKKKSDLQIEMRRLLRKIRRQTHHKTKTINPKTVYNRKDKSWKKDIEEE